MYVNLEDRNTNIKQTPFLKVRLPNDEVANFIQSRSVLIKELVTVLAESKDENYKALVTNLDHDALEKVNAKIKGKKYRFLVEGINKKISMPKQIEIVALFDHLPLDKDLLELREFETAFRIIDNKEDGKIFFGH